MRIIDPRQFTQAQAQRKHGHKRRWAGIYIALLSFVVAGYVYYALGRPLPGLEPTRTAQISVPAIDVSLTWPAYGQSALGAQGYGVLAKNGEQKAVPMASIAKVMAALAVLKKHPLGLNQQGPLITISAADVQSYYDYAAQGGVGGGRKRRRTNKPVSGAASATGSLCQ